MLGRTCRDKIYFISRRHTNSNQKKTPRMKYSGCTISPPKKYKNIWNHIHHKPNMGYKLHAIWTYMRRLKVICCIRHNTHTSNHNKLVSQIYDNFLILWQTWKKYKLFLCDFLFLVFNKFYIFNVLHTVRH